MAKYNVQCIYNGTVGTIEEIVPKAEPLINDIVCNFKFCADEDKRAFRRRIEESLRKNSSDHDLLVVGRHLGLV